MNAAAPILVAGMFDMDNFGDLLFPLLARRRLAEAGFATLAVAPSSSRPGFADALAPIAATEMLAGEQQVGGILVGGGYMIHASPLGFLDRYRGGEAASWGGPGMWIGATLAAALRDVAIAWNAPGVPHPFSVRQQPVVRAALRAASYVAVRDHASRRLLGIKDASDGNTTVEVVPDPVAELPLLWPRPMLEQPFRHLLARKHLSGEARLLAVHVRNRSIAGEDPAALAGALATFAAERGLIPMLVAVGESHDDPAVARRLAASLPAPSLLLDDPVGLQEVAAALAHSSLYIGASLHGYVAATAYGVPGVLVGRPAYHKFAGFLDHIGRPQDLAADWQAALALAALPRRGAPFPASIGAALDQHWCAIVAALRAPAMQRSARAAFACDLLRAGVLRDGPGWAMQPIINRHTVAAGPSRDRGEGGRDGRSSAM